MFVYIDNIVVNSSDPSFISTLKRFLRIKFQKKKNCNIMVFSWHRSDISDMDFLDPTE